MKFNSNSVIALVAINAIVYILTSVMQTLPVDLVALYFPENDKFGVWQILSHLFVHGSFAHLLFNMFALFSFGTALESLWGTKRFLIFYFIAGFGAALIYTLVNYYQFNGFFEQLIGLGISNTEINAFFASGSINNVVLTVMSQTELSEFYSIFHMPAVGASGAIYGILVAYAITYPNAKLALIFLPIPVSAKYFVPVLIAADLFFGMTNYSIGNIAHFAHIGGAVFGIAMMMWWKRRK